MLNRAKHGVQPGEGGHRIDIIQDSPSYPRYFSEWLFPKLTERHRELDFRTRYQDWTVPEDSRTFTLGGHDKELGHIHINFSKRANGWVLNEISACK
jgi:hypothetical protein